jgi:hypothetical protein
MEKELGVKLTGSEELLGTPLQPKGKKGEASKAGGGSAKGKEKAK